MPAITVVRYINRYRQPVSLLADCQRKNTLPSLAYGRKACSLKFKRDPQNIFCNHDERCKEVWRSGGKVEKWIGYEKGEERRAKNLEDKKYTYRHPLIEWGIDRAECTRIIAEAGLPAPGKSSCFFCPSMKKNEILDLSAAYPDLMATALELEDSARPGFRSIKGLGRRFSWREFIEGDPNATLFAEHCSLEAACGCYDGD
jgi:hypothetical protein